MPHEIHTSERKSFRGCRRRWNWIFRDNWYPKVTAKPLEFGVAYHKAMEVFYDPKTWDWPIHIRIALSQKAFHDTCEAQRKAFLALEDAAYLEDEAQEDYDERLELGKGMLAYYAQQVQRTDHRFKPVKVELSFAVPIINPETGNQLRCFIPNCRQHGPEDNGVVFAGRVDMLAEDEHRDYWIFDWKTAARLSVDNDEFLYLDDQIGSYVWALGKELQLPIRGFIYHEQKKGFPQDPVENKVLRLGRRYSVNKQQDTDYQTYLDCVMKNDPHAFNMALYDDMLDWLQAEGPQFFHRYQIHKSQHELQEIGKNIYLEACDILDPGLRLYPNAGRFSCGWCAFRQPCMGVNQGEDYNYTLKTMFDQREHHYWIREDMQNPTTEKRGRVSV